MLVRPFFLASEEKLKKRIMRIYLQSNFFVPGFEKAEWVDFDRTSMTLREFLQELSAKAPTPVEYVRQGAKALDPDDWEVDVNGVPYQNGSDGLETPLKHEDTVTLRLLAFGGG
jgi:hypothetical protein